MKVTNNLNIKMNRDRLSNDRVVHDGPYRPSGCGGKQSLPCELRPITWTRPEHFLNALGHDKFFDKKVTPIVKEQAKTPSF